MTEHIWKQIAPMGFGYGGFYSWLVCEAPRGETLVELGVCYGQSLAFLAVEAANANKGLRVVGVDLFDFGRIGKRDGGPLRDTTGKPIADGWLRKTGLDNWMLIEEDCADAAKNFADESVWAVYVDADHREEQTGQHIDAWWPKLKAGGIMSGHDFNDVFPGVEKAVRKRFGDNFKRTGTKQEVWWARK
jgi:hypothetical protein